MMKVGPVSGDLVIELALLGGAAVCVYLALRKLQGIGGSIADGASALADAAATDLNPASDQNLAYRGVNAFGGAIASSPTAPGVNADGSWTFGGWLYDVTHSP